MPQHEPTSITDFTCATCVAHLVEAEFQLLPESDTDVVNQHLSECPDCRLFNEQLERTRDVLAATPTPELSDDLAEVLQATQVDLADGNYEASLSRLYRIAGALDLENADELVQQTVLEAISAGRTLDLGDLGDRLAHTAAEQKGQATESLYEDRNGSHDYDPDSEPGELFYPDFYQEGPDAGRFIESPNAWGHTLRLQPEDDVATIELFGVTDSAIDNLPELDMRLITLVDIDGVSLEQAALGLGVRKEQATKALNRARIHVRGAIDNYLQTSDPG